MDTNNETTEVAAVEIYLSSDGTKPTENDEGLIVKEILREGEWAYRPGPGQVPTQRPLKVVAGHAADHTEIGFADLQEAFDANAMDHVTIPTSHEDKPHENTGFIRNLEVKEVDGSKRLYAGFDFTEPDIKEKALRGSIANTSVGVVFDYIKKSTGDKFKQALGHVALTNKPWINGMAPFAASEGFSEDEIGYVEIEPDNAILEPFKLDGIEDFDSAREIIIARAKELGHAEWLPSDWTKETSSDETSTDDGTPENNNGDKETNSMSKTPEEVAQEEKNRVEAEKVTSETLSEEAIAKIVKDAQDKADAKAEARFSELEAKNKALEADLHEKKVVAKIAELKEEGFSEYPGLLKTIEELYLADTGSDIATLTLSEEGKEDAEVKVSLSEVVERITNSLPKEDGKLALGEQVHEFNNFNERPSTSSDTDVDPIAAADEINRQLGRPVPQAKEGN